MPRAPQRPCRAIPEQIAPRDRRLLPEPRFSSKWPSSSLCNGASCAIASCCTCAATVKEFVHTRARLMANTVGSNRALEPICLRSHPSPALPALRRMLSSAKDLSSESVSSKSVKIKMCGGPCSCCYVHRAMQNPKWLLEAVRGRQMMIIPRFALRHE